MLPPLAIWRIACPDQSFSPSGSSAGMMSEELLTAMYWNDLSPRNLDILSWIFLHTSVSDSFIPIKSSCTLPSSTNLSLALRFGTAWVFGSKITIVTRFFCSLIFRSFVCTLLTADTLDGLNCGLRPYSAAILLWTEVDGCDNFSASTEAGWSPGGSFLQYFFSRQIRFLEYPCSVMSPV